MNNKWRCCWCGGKENSTRVTEPPTPAPSVRPVQANYQRGQPTTSWKSCFFIYHGKAQEPAFPALIKPCWNPSAWTSGRPQGISINSNVNNALLQQSVFIPVEDVLEHTVPRAEDQRVCYKLPSKKNDHFLGLFLIDRADVDPHTLHLSAISQFGVTMWDRHSRMQSTRYGDALQGWRGLCVPCKHSPQEDPYLDPAVSWSHWEDS